MLSRRGGVLRKAPSFVKPMPPVISSGGGELAKVNSRSIPCTAPGSLSLSGPLESWCRTGKSSPMSNSDRRMVAYTPGQSSIQKRRCPKGFRIPSFDDIWNQKLALWLSLSLYCREWSEDWNKHNAFRFFRSFRTILHFVLPTTRQFTQRK
jgi:hypothetical protein